MVIPQTRAVAGAGRRLPVGRGGRVRRGLRLRPPDPSDRRRRLARRRLLGCWPRPRRRRRGSGSARWWPPRRCTRRWRWPGSPRPSTTCPTAGSCSVSAPAHRDAPRPIGGSARRPGRCSSAWSTSSRVSMRSSTATTEWRGATRSFSGSGDRAAAGRRAPPPYLMLAAHGPRAIELMVRHADGMEHLRRAGLVAGRTPPTTGWRWPSRRGRVTEACARGRPGPGRPASLAAASATARCGPTDQRAGVPRGRGAGRGSRLRRAGRLRARSGRGSGSRPIPRSTSRRSASSRS